MTGQQFFVKDFRDLLCRFNNTNFEDSIGVTGEKCLDVSNQMNITSFYKGKKYKNL